MKRGEKYRGVKLKDSSPGCVERTAFCPPESYYEIRKAHERALISKACFAQALDLHDQGMKKLNPASQRFLILPSTGIRSF